MSDVQKLLVDLHWCYVDCNIRPAAYKLARALALDPRVGNPVVLNHLQKYEEFLPSDARKVILDWVRGIVLDEFTTVVVRDAFALIRAEYQIRKERSERKRRTRISHFVSACGYPSHHLQNFLQEYLEKYNYQFGWITGGGDRHVYINHPDAATVQSLVDEMVSAGRARNWDLSCVLRAKAQTLEIHYVPQCSTGRPPVVNDECSAAEVKQQLV